jgi:hypothetical protein
MFFNNLVYSSNTSCSSGVTPAAGRSVRLRRGFERSRLLSFIAVVGCWALQTSEERKVERIYDGGIGD